MASGGIGNQSLATIFQARLITGGGTSSILTLGRYQGNKVVVAGQTVMIPSVGIQVDVADDLINASGASAGAPGAANTLYYVYVSNQKSPFSPLSIRLSATAPSLVNGVKYLGISGNALNWRFVGWVLLNATPNFQFSDAYGGIVNFYNQLKVTLFTSPGYVNDGADHTWSPSNTGSWEQVNAGVGNLIKLISNGEDAVELFATTKIISSGQNSVFGIGIDGPGNVTKPAQLVAQNIIYQSPFVQDSRVFSEGNHTAELVGGLDATVPFYLNGPLLNSPANVYWTYLTAVLRV